MGWKAYRLVYQAKSPIHIGWHTLGYIKLTRYYITGKAMWGALTANLTRAGEEKNPEAYQKYGKLFRTDVLLSYFYPAIDPDIPLLPEFTDKGLKYGDFAESEFERLFIKSYGQTAVLPDSNTAEDESLHESEFIAPVVRDEKTKEQSPVYFVGYIFIKDGAKTKDNEPVGWDSEDIKLKPILSEVFVGGDRKYGWGKLKLFNRPEENDEQSEMFGFKLIFNNEKHPLITIQNKAHIPAHLDVGNNLKLKGNIEPLVGREWGESNSKIGAGQMIIKEKVCWMPGSTLLEPKNPPLPIGKFGILKIP